MDLIILGIDPGVYSTGLAVISFGPDGRAFARWHECFEETLPSLTRIALRGHGKRTPPGYVVEEIMRRIAPWYQQALATFRPAFAVVESAFFQRPGNNTAQVAEIRGVLRYLTLQSDPAPDWCEVTPTETKKHLLGSGYRKTKKEMQQEVSARLALPDLLRTKNTHVADAYACALTWGHKHLEV